MYKLLTADGSSCNGGVAKWHLPTQAADGSWMPGDWMPPIDNPKLCSRGYHLLPDLWDILEWEGAALFAAEGRGATDFGTGKSAVEEARLLRLVTATLRQSLTLFSADCAERVLYLYEAAYAQDMRPRKAIETTRAWALNPTDENAAAWATARATVRDAARAAGDAAWDAARAAAWDAAGAAGHAAGAAELEWQKRHLAELLGEVPA